MSHMEISIDTNQSSLQGCSTPPRSNIPPSTNLSFSELFHQSKILTSAELKRRFSPIKASVRKRRHNLIRKTDSIVPLKQNLYMPVLLEKLFDYQEDDLSNKSINQDDSVVPLASDFPHISTKIIHPRPIFDYFIPDSCKTKQEHLFSISDTIMKQKFQTLLQKH